MLLYTILNWSQKMEGRKYGVTRKAKKNKGNENLFSHVKQKHTDFADQIYSSKSKLDFTIPEDTKRLYGWLEWVIMTGQPFSFVDNNLTPITRPTLMKYLQILVREEEKKIESELPEKFGRILDGWSENGSETHYVGTFAVYQSKGQPETRIRQTKRLWIMQKAF